MHKQVFLTEEFYSLKCTYKSIVMWLRIIPVAKIARPEDVQHQSNSNPAY